MSQPGDDQPTRVCAAPPSPASAEGPGNNGKSDETVIMTPGKQNDTPRNNARFIPHVGRCDDGQKTTIWSPKPAVSRAVIAVGLRRWTAGLTKGHAAAVCLVFVLAALFITSRSSSTQAMADDLGIHTWNEPASPPSPTPQRKPSPLVTLTPEHPVPPPTPLLPIEWIDDGITLNAASKSLLDGRFDEALSLYRQLAERYPHNRSYAMAADILGGADGGRSK